MERQDRPVCLDDLVRVGGAQGDESWDRAQRRSCSTGWCVGPSSPSPIASCVKTQSTGSSISAESRSGRR
jgi:hypothetical protein